MKTRIKGLSFRNLQFELPVGSYLDVIDDPCGKVTGQKHNDKNAKALYYCSNEETLASIMAPDKVGAQYKTFFLGYIPKEMNQNEFKSVKVSQVWYKEHKEGQQPVGDNYIDGAFIAGIEIECEGYFQITGEDGRIYEAEGKEYQSITSFLADNFPSNPDNLIKWALGNYNSYEEYQNGLNNYAEDGTSLHQLIESYLKDKTLENWDALPDNAKDFMSNIFLKNKGSKVISLESRCYDDNLKLAGTCDAVLEIKGKRIAFDWKSSKKVQDKHKVQVAFYGKNNDCDIACVVCFGAENKRGYSISWVDVENGYKYLTSLVEASIMRKNLTYKLTNKK